MNEDAQSPYLQQSSRESNHAYWDQSASWFWVIPTGRWQKERKNKFCWHMHLAGGVDFVHDYVSFVWYISKPVTPTFLEILPKPRGSLPTKARFLALGIWRRHSIFDGALKAVYPESSFQWGRRVRGHAVSTDFPNNLLDASLHCRLHKVGFIECRLTLPSTVSCMNFLATCNHPDARSCSGLMYVSTKSQITHVSCEILLALSWNQIWSER